MKVVLLILIIINILLFLFVKRYVQTIKFGLPIKKETFFNLVDKLNIPKFYNYYNPSPFVYNNKVYSTHRVHYGSYYSITKIIRERIAGKKFPSYIAITTENNNVINVKIPFVMNISKFNKYTRNKKYKIVGYEDARPLIIKDNLYLLVNTFVNSTKYCQHCLIKIDSKKLDNNPSEITYDDLILINPSLNQRYNQKNWMPLIKDDKLYLFYGLNPLEIYECNIDNGAVKLIHKELYKSVPKNLRGGSHVLEYYSKMFSKNVYVCIVHTKRKNYYTHSFVIIDYPFKILALSGDFIIKDDFIRFIEYSKLIHIVNIQFVSGLLIDKDKMIVYYGENDCISNKFEIDIDIMEKSLVKII